MCLPANPNHLTPMQLRALAWLEPGSWHAATLIVSKGLHSLALHRPDLVKRRVTKHIVQYRLTPDGWRERVMLANNLE